MTPPVSFRGSTETSLHSEIRDDVFQKDPAPTSNLEGMSTAFSSSPRLGALSRFEGKAVEGRRFASDAEAFSWQVQHPQKSNLETVTNTRSPLAKVLTLGAIALTPLLAYYHGELLKWFAENPSLNTLLSALGVSIFGMVHSPRSTAALMEAAQQGDVAAIEELKSVHTSDLLLEIADREDAVWQVSGLETLAELGNSQAKKRMRHFDIAPLLEKLGVDRGQTYGSPIEALVNLAKSGNAAARKALKAPATAKAIVMDYDLRALAQAGNEAAFDKILQKSERGLSESLKLLSLGKKGREAAKKLNLKDWALNDEYDLKGLSQLAQLGHPRARKVFLQAAATNPKAAAELLKLAEAPWVKGALKNFPVNALVQKAGTSLECLAVVIDFAKKGNAEAQRSLSRIDLRPVFIKLSRYQDAEDRYLAPLAKAGNPYAYLGLARHFELSRAENRVSGALNMLTDEAKRGIEIAIWAVQKILIPRALIRDAEESTFGFHELADLAKGGNVAAQQALAEFDVAGMEWGVGVWEFYQTARYGNPGGLERLLKTFAADPENEAVRSYLQKLADQGNLKAKEALQER